MKYVTVKGELYYNDVISDDHKFYRLNKIQNVRCKGYFLLRRLGLGIYELTKSVVHGCNNAEFLDEREGEG